MRVLWTFVGTAAIAGLAWTAGLAAGQATQAGERQRLVGVWELVSLQDHRPNGEVLDWMGKKPSGTDPRPSAGSMWSTDGRDLLPSAPANDIRDAYRGYYAYFGSWEVDERAHRVTHHIRGSLRSVEVGANYVRP